MSITTTILIRAAGRSVRAKLTSEKNSELVGLVRSQLPLTSFALHPSVSGESFSIPSMIAYIGPSQNQMVDHHRGGVYLNASSQSILVAYGRMHQSTPSIKFAEIFHQDLPELTAMGVAIYSDTLITAQHKAVPIEVSMLGEENTLSLELHVPHIVQTHSTWKDVEAYFLAEAISTLSREPSDICTCFAGIIPSGMGTGGNVLPVWMHQWVILMTVGPSTLYQFLIDAEIPGITLENMVQLTHNHLLRVFNHFEFLGDLGLTRFRYWGQMYSSALNQVKSLAEYKSLTTALLTLVNLYFSRVQSRFPFFLGRSFPSTSKEEVLLLATVLKSN